MATRYVDCGEVHRRSGLQVWETMQDIRVRLWATSNKSKTYRLAETKRKLLTSAETVEKSPRRRWFEVLWLSTLLSPPRSGDRTATGAVSHIRLLVEPKLQLCLALTKATEISGYC